MGGFARQVHSYHPLSVVFQIKNKISAIRSLFLRILSLFYFLPLLASKLHARNKIKKAPMLSHRGFVVAGAGLFNDPEEGEA